MGEIKTQRLASVKQPTCYRVLLGCFAIGCRQQQISGKELKILNLQRVESGDTADAGQDKKSVFMPAREYELMLCEVTMLQSEVNTQYTTEGYIDEEQINLLRKQKDFFTVLWK